MARVRKSWPLLYVIKQRGLSEAYFKRIALRMFEIVVEVDGHWHRLKMEVKVKGTWRPWRHMVLRIPAYRLSRPESLRLRCICEG
jgi:hypothetical protein